MPFLGTEERRSRMGMDGPAQGQGQSMTDISSDFPLIFLGGGDGPIWGITLTRTPASRVSTVEFRLRRDLKVKRACSRGGPLSMRGPFLGVVGFKVGFQVGSGLSGRQLRRASSRLHGISPTRATLLQGTEDSRTGPTMLLGCGCWLRVAACGLWLCAMHRTPHTGARAGPMPWTHRTSRISAEDATTGQARDGILQGALIWHTITRCTAHEQEKERAGSVQ